MERAVREGDTGLHHTAKTRRCLLASGPASSQRAGPANPMVSRAGVLQPIRSESVLPWRPEPPLRFAPRLGQASHDSARPRGAIMPGSPPDFNTRSTRFSTDRVTRDRRRRAARSAARAVVPPKRRRHNGVRADVRVRCVVHIRRRTGGEHRAASPATARGNGRRMGRTAQPRGGQRARNVAWNQCSTRDRSSCGFRCSSSSSSTTMTTA